MVDGGWAVRGLTDGWGIHTGEFGLDGCLTRSATRLKSLDPLEQCCRYNGFVAVVVTSTLLHMMLVSLCYCRSHALGRGGNVLFYKHCCP